MLTERRKRTFRVASARRVYVQKLVDFERIFAARLTELFHFSHVWERVKGTAKVRLPAFWLVDFVRTFACTDINRSQSVMFTNSSFAYVRNYTKLFVPPFYSWRLE